jgi:hypothetical protein
MEIEKPSMAEGRVLVVEEEKQEKCQSNKRTATSASPTFASFGLQTIDKYHELLLYESVKVLLRNSIWRTQIDLVKVLCVVFEREICPAKS